MLFFKRILQQPDPTEHPVPFVERRRTKRYLVNPKFHLKAVLNYVARDESGAPMSHSRHGWNWKGRLIDCSEQGVRIQMGPTLRVMARDLCDLMLTVQDFELTIPCYIANIRENAEGLVFGLKHKIEEEGTWHAYQQLLEVLALGSTLRLHSKTAEPDESGYRVEHYVSDRPARLTIWRDPEDKSVAAFEFQMKDSLVRAAEGYGMGFLTGDGAESLQPRSAKAQEIQRLFNWVVPNLSQAVPEDVREILHRYAG